MDGLMKKLLIFIVLLLLIGGVVFFFGWIQILLPPGTYAVIHTKTGGYDEDVLPAGTFTWRIERLLPTNMTVFIFPVEPVEIDTTAIKGTLPSGSLYGSLLKGSPDFSFEIKLRLVFSLKPEALPLLMEKEALKPEALDTWYQSKADLLLQRIYAKVTEEPDSFFEANFSNNIIKELSGDSDFRFLNIKQITPLQIKLPDLELYQAAKGQYFSLARARQDQDVLAINAEKNNLKVLKEYAEILTEYPILLKYLYLKELKGEGLDILNLDLSDPSDLQIR
jgi:hypothetical protein